ncbi:MAG: hypothetical protein ACRC1W_02315 [Shewanella sp.]
MSEALVKRNLAFCGEPTLTASLAINQGLALHLTGLPSRSLRFWQRRWYFQRPYPRDRNAIASQQVHKVLIFDDDVHHGDSSATLSHQPQGIISCSIHC